jgi:hypothetical protein
MSRLTQKIARLEAELRPARRIVVQNFDDSKESALARAGLPPDYPGPICWVVLTFEGCDGEQAPAPHLEPPGADEAARAVVSGEKSPQEPGRTRAKTI